MSKKLIAAAVAALVAVVAYVGSAKFTSGVALSELQLANVEALADGEGTPVGECFMSSDYGENNIGWYIFCDRATSSSMIYPCSSSTTFGRASAKFVCTK